MGGYLKDPAKDCESLVLSEDSIVVANIDCITCTYFVSLLFVFCESLLPNGSSFVVLYPGLSEQTTRGAKCCQHGA